jgi:hypothetical protein
MISADHNLQVSIDVSQTTSSSSNNRVTTKKTCDQHGDHTLGRILDVAVLPGDRREHPGGEIVPDTGNPEHAAYDIGRKLCRT